MVLLESHVAYEQWYSLTPLRGISGLNDSTIDG